jgi:hypothetical protein
MSQARVDSHVLPLTQEFPAQMLGARRASVSVAAGILRRAGLIEYARGHVTVLDRSAWMKPPASVTRLSGDSFRIGRASPSKSASVQTPTSTSVISSATSKARGSPHPRGLTGKGGLPMSSVQAGTNWVELYRAALIETDKAKLRDRIESAQKVLRERAGELTGNGNGSAEEMRAIDDALRALRCLLELYAV